MLLCRLDNSDVFIIRPKADLVHVIVEGLLNFVELKVRRIQRFYEAQVIIASQFRVRQCGQDRHPVAWLARSVRNVSSVAH